MRHPSEGVLRRLVDEPAGVTDDDRAHVAGCPTCLRALDTARADAQLVGAALAAPATRDVDTDAAWARLSTTTAATARTPSGGRGRRARPVARRRCAVRRSPRSAPSSSSPAPEWPPPTTGCRSSAPSRSTRSR